MNTATVCPCPPRSWIRSKVIRYLYQIGPQMLQVTGRHPRVRATRGRPQAAAPPKSRPLRPAWAEAAEDVSVDEGDQIRDVVPGAVLIQIAAELRRISIPPYCRCGSPSRRRSVSALSVCSAWPESTPRHLCSSFKKAGGGGRRIDASWCTLSGQSPPHRAELQRDNCPDSGGQWCQWWLARLAAWVDLPPHEEIWYYCFREDSNGAATYVLRCSL